MKSRQFTVTSSNSPLTIPLSHRGGPTGIAATPTAATYTVNYTIAPLNEGATINEFAIAAMSGVTTAETAEIGPVTAIIVTLDSGTSVSIDVAQSDV